VKLTGEFFPNAVRRHLFDWQTKFGEINPMSSFKNFFLISRNFYDNTTWCFCDFDHWCNGAESLSSPANLLIVILPIAILTLILGQRL
jgi:hypothetical protein